MYPMTKISLSRRGIGASAAALLCALLFCALPGCGSEGRPPLVLAATSDLEGSGLLEAWASDFQRRSGRAVEVVTDTDDRVCDMARHGECDLILTHVSHDEESLERSGYVTDRQEVMRGEYMLVGPPGDPAGAREADGIPGALRRIAEAGQPFVLRVDGSGAAIKAGGLWSLAGLEEAGDWLRRSMESEEGALREAAAERAYALTMRHAFERLAGELGLEVVREGGEDLEDSYHAMVVSTLTYPDTDVAGALEFISYLLSEAGQGHLGTGPWRPPTQ